jgi:negative regulator of genetic competence, sporulation and motility
MRNIDVYVHALRAFKKGTHVCWRHTSANEEQNGAFERIWEHLEPKWSNTGAKKSKKERQEQKLRIYRYFVSFFDLIQAALYTFTMKHKNKPSVFYKNPESKYQVAHLYGFSCKNQPRKATDTHTHIHTERQRLCYYYQSEIAFVRKASIFHSLSSGIWI